MLRHKVTLFSLLGLLLLSTVADAKIIFSSLRDGVYSIHVMDDDGSNQTLITESEDLRPVLPQWSPDGKQILFQRRTKINANNSSFPDEYGWNERSATHRKRWKFLSTAADFHRTVNLSFLVEVFG